MFFFVFFRNLFFCPGSSSIALLNEFAQLWSNEKLTLVGFEPAGVRGSVPRSEDHLEDRLRAVRFWSLDILPRLGNRDDVNVLWFSFVRIPELFTMSYFSARGPSTWSDRFRER